MPLTLKYSLLDVQKLTGLSQDDIFRLVTQFKLFNPQEDSSIQQNKFSYANLHVLLQATTLLKNGYTLTQILGLSKNEMAETEEKLNNSANIEPLFERILSNVLRLDEEGFRFNLSAALRKKGFIPTIEILCIPLLKHIGNLWHDSIINPSQEHMASNVIREMIIVENNKKENYQVTQPLKFVLLLPEYELHEIGLLLYYNILQRRGHRCLYLGQYVPLADLPNIVTMNMPGAFVTTFVSALSHDKLERSIQLLLEAAEGKPIFIGGVVERLNGKPLPKNIFLFNGYYDFEQVVTAALDKLHQ